MKQANRMLPTTVAAAVLAISWVASPTRAVIPPDPDNAALLYYQAFLTMADLAPEARSNISDVAAGVAAPNEKTRQYVDKCRAAIEFADAAKGLQVCNWGFRYSQGFDALMPQLAQMRLLAQVMLADARIHALDGDYRDALERCLQMTTFARHIGDDTLISYMVGVAVQRLSYQCMNEVIGSAAGDAELMRWFKDELATAGGKGLSPVPSLKIEMEISLGLMRMDKLDKLTSTLKTAGHENMVKYLETADEPAMERARQSYSKYVTSALVSLSEAKPYEQARRELMEPISGLAPNDPASAVVEFITPALDSILSAKTLLEASVNATRAGLEICLKRAETGRLPEVLPAGLPKDPFSGQDFQYERTRTGFVLRCRGKDLAKDKTYEYTFAVK